MYELTISKVVVDFQGEADQEEHCLTLKMKALPSKQMSVNVNRSTWCNNPEELNLFGKIAVSVTDVCFPSGSLEGFWCAAIC